MSGVDESYEEREGVYEVRAGDVFAWISTREDRRYPGDPIGDYGWRKPNRQERRALLWQVMRELVELGDVVQQGSELDNLEAK